MGETEVTERFEVVEKEKVHICDFCGRDNTIQDFEFNDVHIGGKSFIKLAGGRHSTTTAAVEILDEQKEFDGWMEFSETTRVDVDQTLHLCEDCYHAYTGVLQ